jgi:hypothetical protein
MHLRSLSAAAGFATGLLAIYFVPTGGWPLDIVLVLAVSLLGGYMIGQWWAVGVAVGSNIVFSTLYLFAYDDLFRITPNHDSSRVAVILAGQLLVSAIATAVAVGNGDGSGRASVVRVFASGDLPVELVEPASGVRLFNRTR